MKNQFEVINRYPPLKKESEQIELSPKRQSKMTRRWRDNKCMGGGKVERKNKMENTFFFLLLHSKET